jgi:hypothetical protein
MIITLQNHRHVQLLGSESYVIQCMEEYSTTVVIHTRKHWTLTAPSINVMMLLTYISFVNVICIFDLALLLSSDRLDDIKCIGCRFTVFGV